MGPRSPSGSTSTVPGLDLGTCSTPASTLPALVTRTSGRGTPSQGRFAAVGSTAVALQIPRPLSLSLAISQPTLPNDLTSPAPSPCSSILTSTPVASLASVATCETPQTLLA